MSELGFTRFFLSMGTVIDFGTRDLRGGEERGVVINTRGGERRGGERREE